MSRQLYLNGSENFATGSPRASAKINKKNLSEQALLERKVAVLEKSVGRLKEDNKSHNEEIESLEKRLAKYEPTDDEEEGEGILAKLLLWKWYLVGLLLVFGGAVALILTVRGPRGQEEIPDATSEEDVGEANN